MSTGPPQPSTSVPLPGYTACHVVDGPGVVTRLSVGIEDGGPLETRSADA